MPEITMPPGEDNTPLPQTLAELAQIVCGHLTEVQAEIDTLKADSDAKNVIIDELSARVDDLEQDIADLREAAQCAAEA